MQIRTRRPGARADLNPLTRRLCGCLSYDLVDVRVAHNALDGDVDPRRGRAFFGVCRPATVLGRHTIKAKLTSWTGGTSILDPKVEHVVWLEPSTFRMRRPR